MKLYSYSGELLTFTEVRWAKAKYGAGGIFIVIVIVFGFMMFQQPIASAVGLRPQNSLAVENDVLRQELSLMSPRVSRLEIKARQLGEDDNILHLLIFPRKIGGDTISRSVYVPKISKNHSLASATASFSH